MSSSPNKRLCVVRSTPVQVQSSVNNNHHIKIYEWSQKSVRLVCVGFVRQYLRIGVSDIAAILSCYLSSMVFNYYIHHNDSLKVSYRIGSNDVHCNFGTNGSSVTKWTNHTSSTIVLTPFISQLFKQVKLLFLSPSINIVRNEMALQCYVTFFVFVNFVYSVQLINCYIHHCYK